MAAARAKKRKAGRPVSRPEDKAQRIHLTLMPDLWATASDLGHGNAARGIREALKLAALAGIPTAKTAVS
jgi:hypothetical protein